MNVPALLVGLYPPAIRQRWGEEMTHELAASGARSWPDTAIGAARLWLHPGDWPETVPGQTRRVLAVELSAVIAAAVLLVRAAGPSTVLTAHPRLPATSAWLAPVMAGAVLAVPLPPLRRDALGRLAAVTARALAVPVLALLAMYLIAHSGLIDHPTGILSVLLRGYYWATLSFTALGMCTLLARISRIATMPGTRRLRPALLLIGAGLALAACESLAVTLHSTFHAGVLASSCGLAILAAAAITTGQNLRHACRQTT